jgi:hypothetical protein
MTTEKMTLIFEHIVWQNASGMQVSKAGGRDLANALKLEKQGFAKVKQLETKFLGYGKSMDTGTSSVTYEVTFM